MRFTHGAAEVVRHPSNYDSNTQAIALKISVAPAA
jgi:hypothetical protein